MYVCEDEHFYYALCMRQYPYAVDNKRQTVTDDSTYYEEFAGHATRHTYCQLAASWLLSASVCLVFSLQSQLNGEDGFFFEPSCKKCSSTCVCVLSSRSVV